MDAALRIVGLILLLASIAGIVVALRVLRRELPVRPKYDAIRLAIALGSALLITAALSIGTPAWLVAAGIGLGLVLGVLQGRAMKIRVASDGVFATRTTASVVTWGAGMVLAQGAGIANRVGIAAIGLAVAYLSAGMAGGLILGRNQAIEAARRASAGVAVAATALALAAAPLFSFTAPAHAQNATEFDLEVEIFLIAGAEQATLDGTFSGVLELGVVAFGEISGSFFGDLNCFQNDEIIGDVTVSGDVTYDVSGEQTTNDVGERVLAVTLTGRGTVNGVATAPEDNCQAQADDVTAGIGAAVMTFEFEDASFATQDVEFQAGVTTLGATGTIDRIPPPTTTTLPPTTRPPTTLPDDDFDTDAFGDDFSSGTGGFDSENNDSVLDTVDDLDENIAGYFDLSSDTPPGEAAGAALIGVVGVAGLLASSLAEAGMSTSDALRTRRRDDGKPPGPPDDPGGAPPPPPAPSTPGDMVDAPVSGPPPAPDPESVTLEFRTADVSSDVTPDAPPPPAPGPSTPPPPPAPSVGVAPDVTDAPPAPAPATPSAAADVPTAPPPDIDPAAGAVGSALREALQTTGSETSPGAGLGTLLNDVPPSGPGLNLTAEGADAGIGSAVDRVTLALADRSSLTPATISVDEAVMATETSSPTTSFDPLAGVDPAAGDLLSDPTAFARSLLGDGGVEALGDTSRPLGEGVGSRLFPVDVGATDASALATPTGPPPGGESTELVGDIAEDSAEVIADVVEDRGLHGAKRAAATQSGRHTDRDRDADPDTGWTTHRMSPSLREQLGLPDLPLPIRTDRAAAVLGNPIDLPGLVGEIDAYLRAHPWAQRSYADTIALLAHVSGVARGRADDHATALSLFSTGLDYSPDNISLQANQTLALHCLGRHHEAAAAYESLLATPGVRRRSLVGLVAARAYTDAGDENAARALLEEITGN